MNKSDRRTFLGLGAAGLGLAGLPPSIARALATPAARRTGTIKDVEHIVILMMENRSFDHYFGTLRGVRGFGDRHPIPVAGGKTVWTQSDGTRDHSPFHLDTKTTNAMRVRATPHAFSNAQAAWGQGRLDHWPKYKTAYAMGHYKLQDIPFQFALAEAFTICDAYHCSLTSGTDPNRVVFWSGSCFDPKLRAKGINCTAAESEPDNLRCWINGALPEPGYSYAGSALTWPTLPEVLQDAGVSWRMYQDPNNNWTGAMHGGLAFESFRTAKPGSPLYENGMRHWSLDDLADQVKAGTLPQVSWILPPELWSEHPSPSSPIQGAEFTARVLDALTANPESWSKTVFFLTFDENDGLFDHVPPPAPPSFNTDGTMAGKSTLDLAGEYFSDPDRTHLDPTDTLSGTVRPWGLGPRVPMYVISPWSKGGWVNSQVFDHTSMGRFLEVRFGVTIPAISPWHRAISGDLTSAFDFAGTSDSAWPILPSAAGASTALLEHIQRPEVIPPTALQPVTQEPGIRPSRALPYRLEVDAVEKPGTLVLTLTNLGAVGAVFHVYDRQKLEAIPRRYTVEDQKSVADDWPSPGGAYDLIVFGPNGFLRTFSGRAADSDARGLIVQARQNPAGRTIDLNLHNPGKAPTTIEIIDDVYRRTPLVTIILKPGERLNHAWSATASHDWYDLTLRGPGLERRLAGRIETGRDGVSDPAV